jgi:hypothetical protein
MDIRTLRANSAEIVIIQGANAVGADPVWAPAEEEGHELIGLGDWLRRPGMVAMRVELEAPSAGIVSMSAMSGPPKS